MLKKCFEETGHGVPNSLLHTIENVGKCYIMLREVDWNCPEVFSQEYISAERWYNIKSSELKMSGS